MTDAAMRLPFSDQDLTKIGYLVTLWGQVEMFLNMSIATSLRIEPKLTSTILGEISVSHRAKILKDAAPRRLVGRPGMLALLEDCVTGIGYLAPYRNDIVHAKWAQLDIKKGWKKLSMEHEVDFGVIDAKTEEMAVLSNKIAALMMTLLMDAVKENGGTVEGLESPWRDKFVPRIPLD